MNHQAYIPKRDRIVLLFDLDCFYAQCERVRLGLEYEGCSLVLMQWNSALAVTYPAREFGIKRGDSWDDVQTKSKGKCNAIHLHILQPSDHKEEEEDEEEEDVELKETEEDIKTAFDRIYKLSPEQQLEARKQLGVRRKYTEGKACLERYRLASMRIFSVVLESLTNHLGKEQFVLERASIDEFYLDITKYCYNDNGKSGDRISLPEVDPTFVPHQKPTVVVGDSSVHNAQPKSPLHLALKRACAVSHQIRTDVWNTLGFTMSAGISTNKMMAKLSAGYGKPNGQAVLCPQNFERVMETTQLRKVRNFGGKLGKRVRDKLLNGKEDATMGEVADISLPTLLHHFSQETALIVFDACRGTDHEEVKETTGALVKSITAFKSFTATSQVSEVEKWLNVITNEIVTRVHKDTARNKRYPKTLTLNYTYYTTANGRRPNDGTHRSQRNTKSVRLHYPNESSGTGKQKADFLQKQAMSKLLPILKEQKLRGVGMSANNFEAKGQPPTGVSSIETFFGEKKTGDGVASSGATTTSSHRFSSISSQQPSRPGVEQYFTSKSETTESPSDTEQGQPLQTSAKQDQDCRAITPDVSSDEKLAKELQASFSKENHPSDSNPQVFSKEASSASITTTIVDKDMELARKLQAQYDRENYIFTATSRRSSAGGPSKKKVKRIDSFFQKR